jgi:predicted HTH transcriptional regulator
MSFSAGRNLRRGDLRTLSITKVVGGRECPTIGGLLLFGKQRHEWFPDAVLEIARFQGITRTEMLDMQTIEDFPALAVDRALAITSQYTRQRFVLDGARRVSEGHVPESALREALVNAVVHTDYSQKGSRIRVAAYHDRIEIENPGMLPWGMTIEDMRAGHSKLRNRVIGRVFRELGLIEQWGTGVQRMIGACAAAGIAEPRFEEIGLHFRVTFPFTAAAELQPSGQSARVLELLRLHGSMSTAAIAKELGRTTRAVRPILGRLVDAGLLAVVGSGPNDPKRQYRWIKSP